MSVVPMQATTSAIRRPSQSFGNDCRFTNDGVRNFTRYGFAEPSLAMNMPNSPRGDSMH